MTGWNLPPGCNVRDLPGNQDEGPCAVCGVDLDGCTCPECPTCGSQGDPFCYREHGLVQTMAQLWGRQKLMEQQYDAAEQYSKYADEVIREEGWL